ncbi:MAG: hypothetical protein ACLPRE_05730 [Limisphaerales bacterium]
MKNTYPIIIFSIMLTYSQIMSAQDIQKPSSTDTALSQKVSGIWLLDDDLLNGVAHVTGTINLATNGDYTIEATMKVTEGEAKGMESANTSMGKWQVKDGCLVMTKLKTHTANGGDQQLSKPEVSTVKIVRVNDNELVYISDASIEKTWKRSK